MSPSTIDALKRAGNAAGSAYMMFSQDIAPETIATDLKDGAHRQGFALAIVLAKPAPLNAGIGELDVCLLCDSSPHVVACPEHPNFADERLTYALANYAQDVGTAAYWVEDTFAAAARDAGLDERAALVEGIEEFTAALERGELRRTTR